MGMGMRTDVPTQGRRAGIHFRTVRARSCFDGCVRALDMFVEPTQRAKRLGWSAQCTLKSSIANGLCGHSRHCVYSLHNYDNVSTCESRRREREEERRREECHYRVLDDPSLVATCWLLLANALTHKVFSRRFAPRRERENISCWRAQRATTSHEMFAASHGR